MRDRRRCTPEERRVDGTGSNSDSIVGVSHSPLTPKGKMRKIKERDNKKAKKIRNSAFILLEFGKYNLGKCSFSLSLYPLNIFFASIILGPPFLFHISIFLCTAGEQAGGVSLTSFSLLMTSATLLSLTLKDKERQTKKPFLTPRKVFSLLHIWVRVWSSPFSLSPAFHFFADDIIGTQKVHVLGNICLILFPKNSPDTNQPTFYYFFVFFAAKPIFPSEREVFCHQRKRLV